MVYVQARQELIGWLRKQLIGPAIDAHLAMSPLQRYPTGVLYPVEAGETGVDPATADPDADSLLLDAEEEDGSAPTGEEVDGRDHAHPVQRRRYVPPSSVGFSFFVRGEARLLITASAAKYASPEDRGERGQYGRMRYERTVLPECTIPWSPANAASRITLWAESAAIDVSQRTHQDGSLFTVTLVNRESISPELPPRERQAERVAKSLFEARVECTIESGELAEYPHVDPSLLTEEEQELEVQYRDRHIYAVGHGAAAEWCTAKGLARIRAEFMPAEEVPITANAPRKDEVLEFARLACANRHDELEQFIEGYAAWVEEQHRVAAQLEPDQRRAAERMCDRMARARQRMQASVQRLRKDPMAAEAFRIANRAMHDQMSRLDPDEQGQTHRWRPFQLAFLLTVIRSAIDEDDEYRDVLDLIWFPTGGGKTEAYLGLVVFLLVWRRLRYRDTGGGTVALMRYTLRLLTRQQFDRAARVICALELLRRQDPARLGEEPFTVGMWIGGGASPNRFEQAMQCVREIADGSEAAKNRLVITNCPWCGTQLDLDASYRAASNAFHFHCVSQDCDFGRSPSPLPCNVVDDALYQAPPSLLIGTIDKFARLAWDEGPGAFFGAGASGCRPPELVIQDELHLVTGPLGSVAGLYEAGLETLLIRRGVRPKYIASTATIRMATDQVRRLYGRDLAVFPPPGLSCDDSYFATTDYSQPGRMYLGYIAPLLDQQHCLAPLAAALLVAPLATFKGKSDETELVDAWWTQIVYHGSLRGVGSSHNAFHTDVRDFGHVLVNEIRHSQVADPSVVEATKVGEVDRFQSARIEQLTSMQSPEKNAETFLRLAKPAGAKDSLDAVLATNMVAVGVDVARLALMVVNGQPLTAAEYIQASSRVGRARVPGIVVANYYRHQARSLSHYENHRAFHQSFYRFVEPSSVTPYTYQVRRRALHAALVIAIRHTCENLRSGKSAGAFDQSLDVVRTTVDALRRRCTLASGDEHGDDVAAHIGQLVDEWNDEAARCREEKVDLHYTTPSRERNAERLLYTRGELRRGLWPTLQSMRNVEGEGVLKVRD